MGSVTNLNTPEDENVLAVCSDETCPSIEDEPNIYDPYPQEKMDEDVDHVVRILDGMGELLSDDRSGELTGNEKYALSCLRLYGYSGNEGLKDDMKKAGEAAYKSIIEILKKIKDFFTGEGRAALEAGEESAKNGLEILAKSDKAKPVAENSKFVNVEALKKKLLVKGISEVLTTDKNLETLHSGILSNIERLKNAKTVANVGAVYQLVVNDAAKLGDAIQRKGRDVVAAAERKANEIRNVKDVTDTSDNEAKQGVKGEQKAGIDGAKADAAVARGYAVLQRAITGLFGTISANSTALAGAKVDSNFKG